MTPEHTVTMRAHAKLNLFLGVGESRPDGYHELSTVFTSLSLHDVVRVEDAPELSLRMTGRYARGLSVEATNLAHRAATALAVHAGIAPRAAVSIEKSIPVAAGLAGGSADAAAVLLACDRLWDLRTPRSVLEELAAGLGSDVPFCVRGGVAAATGRGEQLTSLSAAGEFHWVLLPSRGSLATPAVYAELDRLRAAKTASAGAMDPSGVVAATVENDPARLASSLANDLAAAAMSLMPELRTTMAAGRDAGAMAAVVCGSGPTCAFLTSNAERAVVLAARLRRELGQRGVEFTAEPIVVSSGNFSR